MPDGVVQWFDPATGEGRILRGGRRYVLRADSSETAARVPGARVHFDIDHEAAGDVAANVELRAGTRVSRRQRRFGDLSGSARPDAKGTAPFAHEQPALGRDLQRHPMTVAERWATLLAAGDLAAAMLFYAPDAALHAGGEVLHGSAIRRHWDASPLLGGPAPSSVEDEGPTVVVRWAGAAPDQAPLESRLRIAHGEIAEQWLGAVWTITGTESGPEPVELSVAGAIGEPERRYALDKIGKVLDTIEQPVLHTSIRLERAADPARERPALARAVIDLDGEPVRARVAAASVEEAVDQLEARLRDRLEHVAEHRRALRRRAASSPPGEWRHGDQPNHLPPYYPRPVEDRQVVRHKTFAAPDATVPEAVFDLEAMDYDFFLFTDLASGQDALVERHDDGTYRLRYLHGSDHGAGDRPVAGPEPAVPVEVVERAAPELTLEQAREHLDLADEPRVFFEDAASGRGRVLYRRYDGHYGLITPAGTTGEPLTEHEEAPS